MLDDSIQSQMQPNTAGTSGRGRRALVFALILAAAVRIGLLVWASNSTAIVTYDGRTREYVAEAQHLVAGDGFVKDTPSGLRPASLRPPGMALLLAAAMSVAGSSAERVVQLFGVLVGLLTVWLAWWLARRLLDVRAAEVVAYCVALFLPLAYYEVVPRQPDGIIACFVTAGLACMVRACDGKLPGMLRWVLVAGVVLGLGSLLRSSYMLLPLFLVAPMAWYAGRRGAATAVAVQVLVLTVMMPWALRNRLVLGEWVFTSTEVGGTLVTGLGESQNAWGFGYTDGARGREAARQGIADPFGPEGNRYFREVFWRSIRERPGAYIGTVLKRLPMLIATPFTWGYRNPHKTSTFTEAREVGGRDRYEVIRSNPMYVVRAYWDSLMFAAFSLAAFAAAIMTLVLTGHRRNAALLLFSPHLYGLGVHALVHFEPRFVLASIPCWLGGLAYVIVAARRSPKRGATTATQEG